MTITAISKDEFEKIESSLKELPERVLSQIENVKGQSLLGMECLFVQTYKNENTIYLPNNVSQIKDFGNYIGIYTSDFFFKIDGDLYKSKLNYIFLQ
jgi:hypothetical protein